MEFKHQTDLSYRQGIRQWQCLSTKNSRELIFILISDKIFHLDVIVDGNTALNCTYVNTWWYHSILWATLL